MATRKPIRRHFRAYWHPMASLGRVQVWSFAAGSLDEAQRIVCGADGKPGVVPVRPVEIESSDGKEKGTVSK